MGVRLLECLVAPATRSTPATCSCSFCATAPLQMLIEEGHAAADIEDRWGSTALDDAQEGGHIAVVEYLAPLMQAAKMVGS